MTSIKQGQNRKYRLLYEFLIFCCGRIDNNHVARSIALLLEFIDAVESGRYKLEEDKGGVCPPVPL